MNERVYTVVYMVVVCVLATILLTGAKLVLAERIETNASVRTDRLILAALGIVPKGPGAAEIRRTYDARVASEEREGLKLYYGYTEDGGAVESIGMEFHGKAFWGPMVGVLAIKPDLKTVAGFQMISQQETPGLGARIADADYSAQFAGKDIGEINPDGVYLEFVSEGVETLGPHQVHGVTGATRTTDSLRRILNEDIVMFRKIVEAGDLLQKAPRPGGK